MPSNKLFSDHVSLFSLCISHSFAIQYSSLIMKKFLQINVAILVLQIFLQYLIFQGYTDPSNVYVEAWLNYVL